MDEELRQARCGYITASKANVLLASNGTKPGKTFYDYATELVAERTTGVPAEGFTSDAMQWGTDNEAGAIEAYSAGEFTTQGVFVRHPTLDLVGCTPDLFVEPNGLAEFKCPKSTTHLGYLLDPKVPTPYMRQMQFQMWVTGRQWCDWVSFDPRQREELRIHIIRVEPDPDIVKAIVERRDLMESIIDETLRKLGIAA